jgi:hypothetical protein
MKEYAADLRALLGGLPGRKLTRADVDKTRQKIKAAREELTTPAAKAALTAAEAEHLSSVLRSAEQNCDAADLAVREGSPLSPVMLDTAMNAPAYVRAEIGKAKKRPLTVARMRAQLAEMERQARR